MRASEFLPEIQFNQVTHKSDVSRYDFDDYIGNTEPTGKAIGGYEIHEPVNYPYKAFLIKSNDDEGFLGALQLTKFNGMWKSEVMFAPEIQGKGFAIPLYRYAIIDQGLTIVSDRSQSPGGSAIWEKLSQQPDINVYIYDTGDKKFHGEYDPRDSGRVYGPEDWRHKIRLVATTDTVTSINEAWGKKEVWESATPDDIFFMISNIHTGHRDIESDEEFQQWVGSFDKYELEDIPLSKLKVTQSNINTDKAKSYIKQKNAPPIVVDGTNYWIIDGHHRVAAALARGDKTIKGYVGLNEVRENFHDGKKKGKSRPGRVKRAGASCKGSVTDLRAKAKKYSGEKGKMYHWCANMKAGKKKKK